MTSASIINNITDIYNWLNTVLNPANILNQSTLEQHFTPDFTRNYNGQITTTDYASLHKHLCKIRNGNIKVVLDLPFIDIIVSEDRKKCIVRHSATKTYKDGHTAKNQVTAIYHFAKDGRACYVNEVSYSEDNIPTLQA